MQKSEVMAGQVFKEKLMIGGKEMPMKVTIMERDGTRYPHFQLDRPVVGSFTGMFAVFASHITDLVLNLPALANKIMGQETEIISYNFFGGESIFVYVNPDGCIEVLNNSELNRTEIGFSVLTKLNGSLPSEHTDSGLVENNLPFEHTGPKYPEHEIHKNISVKIMRDLAGPMLERIGNSTDKVVAELSSGEYVDFQEVIGQFFSERTAAMVFGEQILQDPGFIQEIRSNLDILVKVGAGAGIADQKFPFLKPVINLFTIGFTNQRREITEALATLAEKLISEKRLDEKSFLAQYLKLTSDPAAIIKIIEDMIARTEDEAEKAALRSRIDWFITLSQEERIREAIGACFGVMFAGSDTTSGATATFMEAVAVKDGQESTLLKELQADYVPGKKEQPMSNKTIHNIVMAVLAHSPSTPMTQRLATEDIKLSNGFTVHAGEEIMIPIGVLGRMLVIETRNEMIKASPEYKGEPLDWDYTKVTVQDFYRIFKSTNPRIKTLATKIMHLVFGGDPAQATNYCLGVINKAAPNSIGRLAIAAITNFDKFEIEPEVEPEVTGGPTRQYKNLRVKGIPRKVAAQAEG